VSAYNLPANAASFNVTAPAATPTPTPGPTATPAPVPAGAALPLHVQGNKLVNSLGQNVALHGVNRMGTEYACVQGWGMSDGPNDAASIQAMKTWKINAVRIPMNEDCWLGINGVAAAYAGANYQQAIINYVNLLNQNGLYAILDLHWTAPGSTRATQQVQMPDMDHSPTFWSQVATTFRGNNAAIFELFNEPHDISWSCWRNGGSCSGVSYQVAGMQTLLDAVRATGATNVIAQGGLGWSNDLSGWLANRPIDPLNNLAAAWHAYNFNVCNSTSCYDSTAGPVAALFPILVTETGSDTCNDGFNSMIMDWLDARGQSYFPWSWNAGSGCSMNLISDYYSATPTSYGQIYRTHYLAH
jgi:aryl-phospho-beta-D-glucosidase BglC (GH1 family)